jgi:hypothetical protein
MESESELGLPLGISSKEDLRNWARNYVEMWGLALTEKKEPISENTDSEFPVAMEPDSHLTEWVRKWGKLNLNSTLNERKEQMSEFNVIYSDDNLAVVCIEPGHEYRVLKGIPAERSIEEMAPIVCSLSFQNGPIKEAGVNGIQNEPIIALLIDRLEFLDNTFPSEFNKNAIMHLNEALKSLKARTANRVDRGVEGTNVA